MIHTQHNIIIYVPVSCVCILSIFTYVILNTLHNRYLVVLYTYIRRTCVRVFPRIKCPKNENVCLLTWKKSMK